MENNEELTIIQHRVEGAGGEPIEHVLLIHSPGELLRRVPVGDLPVSIGRVAGNTLLLPLPEISRRHCEVVLQGNHAVLHDLGSTNGTYVEGRRIAEPTVLGDGAIIGIGSFTLVYRCGTPALLARAIAAEEELSQASDYVQALLPPPLAAGPVRADWRFVPSAQLGGDAFGYQLLPDGRFAFHLLDVTGHGAGAALLAVSVLNVLRQPQLPGGVAWDDAAGVLTALNHMFPMEQQSGLCFSLWYGLFDPAARSLAYASAGHHPAYLCATGAVPQALLTRNVMVGASDEIPFVGATASVPPDSRLFLFSDGAFEIAAPDGRQHALTDFLPVLEVPPEPGVGDAERLLRAARATNGPGPFADDVSVLVLEFPRA